MYLAFFEEFCGADRIPGRFPAAGGTGQSGKTDRQPEGCLSVRLVNIKEFLWK